MILKEVSLFARLDFPGAELLHFLLNLGISFVKVVGPGARLLSILLLDYDPVDIGLLAEFGIDFNVRSSLFIVCLVPGIPQVMCGGSW